MKTTISNNNLCAQWKLCHAVRILCVNNYAHARILYREIKSNQFLILTCFGDVNRIIHWNESNRKWRGGWRIESVWVDQQLVCYRRRHHFLAIITSVKIIVAALMLLMSYILTITIRTRMYICRIFCFASISYKAIRTPRNREWKTSTIIIHMKSKIK